MKIINLRSFPTAPIAAITLGSILAISIISLTGLENKAFANFYWAYLCYTFTSGYTFEEVCQKCLLNNETGTYAYYCYPQFLAFACNENPYSNPYHLLYCGSGTYRGAALTTHSSTFTDVVYTVPSSIQQPIIIAPNFNATLQAKLKAAAPPGAIFLTHSPVQPGTIVLHPGQVLPSATEIQNRINQVLAGIRAHTIPTPPQLQTFADPQPPSP